MLKRDELTRQEIVDFLWKNMPNMNDRGHLTEVEALAQIEILEHLIDEFGDKNLAYNTDTGFFDYVGPWLPQIPVENSQQ